VLKGEVCIYIRIACQCCVFTL